MVDMHLLVNSLCPLTVLESVDGLLVVPMESTDAADHGGVSVTPQRVFQDPSEFGIPVWNVTALFALVCQDVYTVTQCQ